MPQRSAGVLLYRRVAGAVEVLLVHPGGPFWRRRDSGAWQIPKGQIEHGEDSTAAAVREVEEELGLRLDGIPVPLGAIRQSGGKWVDAFTIEQDFDPEAIESATFEMEWPPKSGRIESFPEVDRAAWLTPAAARDVMLPSQLPLLDRLERHLAAGSAGV